MPDPAASKPDPVEPAFDPDGALPDSERPATAARSDRTFRRRAAGWALGVSALMAVTAVVAGVWLWTSTPDAAQVAQTTAITPSRIVSADGVVLETIGKRVHQPVTLDQVSPHVVAALLATEDKRFFEHGGIDVRRMAAAVWASARGDIQGGSTITQQLARNLFPKRVGTDRSLLRKVREMVVALKIERAYDKREILTMYLNQVPFLYNVTGIEMAAQTYFGKPSSALERHEAALLVAMLKGPHYYDPLRWPQRALQRRDLVLTLMQRRESGVDAPRARSIPGIAVAAAAAGDAARSASAATAEPLGLRLQRRDLEPHHAPHFVQEVRRQIADWAAAHDVDLTRDGLTIHTTLDTRVQAIAEEAVRRQSAFLQQKAGEAWAARGRKGKADGVAFGALWSSRPELMDELARQTPAFRQAVESGLPEAKALERGRADPALDQLRQEKTRLEAGFVVLDPRTGGVAAYVGSRDYAVDRYDHVAQAQRQPGSTFKPFVYGAALQAGVSPWQTYLDTTPSIPLSDGTVWAPGDSSGASGEPMTLRDGLARSKNSITVQVMQRVGVPHVVRLAREMGIERATLDPVPSLALGTSPVSLLEMARAYGTLATLGVRRDVRLVSHIVDRDGIEVARFGSQPRQALDENTAVVLVDILRDAVDRGTGRMLRTRFGIEADIAGKTGTTQRNTDGWFIAIRPNLVAAAWVGFNDQRVTMRGNAWGQGGHSALLIVGDFVRAADKAGLLDLTQRFPEPPPPPPPPEPEPEPIDPLENQGYGAMEASWVPGPTSEVQRYVPGAMPLAESLRMPAAPAVDRVRPPVDPGSGSRVTEQALGGLAPWAAQSLPEASARPAAPMPVRPGGDWGSREREPRDTGSIVWSGPVRDAPSPRDDRVQFADDDDDDGVVVLPPGARPLPRFDRLPG